MLYDDKGATYVSTEDFQSSKITAMSDNNSSNKNSDISVCLSDVSIIKSETETKPRKLTAAEIKYNLAKNTLDSFDIVTPDNINFETLKNKLQVLSDKNTKTILLQSFKEKLEQNLV